MFISCVENSGKLMRLARMCVCVVEGPIKNFRAQMATEIHSGATGTLIQSSAKSGFKATCTIYSLFLTFV
jgi:hypothetical protein